MHRCGWRRWVRPANPSLYSAEHRDGIGVDLELRPPDIDPTPGGYFNQQDLLFHQPIILRGDDFLFLGQDSHGGRGGDQHHHGADE
jgi:hypothetical protein